MRERRVTRLDETRARWWAGDARCRGNWREQIEYPKSPSAPAGIMILRKEHYGF